MRKTSVYLDEEGTRKLKWLADAQGLSQAQVLREAIAVYAERAASRFDRDFVSAGAAEGPGGSVADIPEDELLRGFGENSLGERPDRNFEMSRVAEAHSGQLPTEENWRSVADTPEEELLKGFGEDSLADYQLRVAQKDSESRERKSRSSGE